MKRIDMNNTVKVKLTSLGADIYYHRLDDVNDRIVSNDGEKIEPHLPEVDKDGFTKFQLWDFVRMFGQYFGLGMPNVISDLCIYVSDEDLEEVNTE